MMFPQCDEFKMRHFPHCEFKCDNEIMIWSVFVLIKKCIYMYVILSEGIRIMGSEYDCLKS